MKKILYTTALSALLIAGVGCSKSKLNLFPFNQVATQQAFKDQSSVTFDVNGMYDGMKTATAYFVTGTWNIVWDVLADNLITNPTGRGSLKTPYYNYSYNANSTYGLFTSSTVATNGTVGGGGYTITRRANAILENIGTFPDGAFKNNAKGEAYAVRALVYFDMCRVYSKTYLNATASDYTLPYVTTTVSTNLPPSEPLQPFYDKVIADLVLAESLINPLATNTNIHMNKEAVAGLLSRVYLYKGDYANTIAQANIALGTTPNLPNITNFPAIWVDGTAGDPGVLFKVKNTAIDNINGQGVNYWQYTPPPAGSPTQNGYKSEWLPDFGLYSLYAANDVRKPTYFLTSYFNGSLYNTIIKYAGRTGPPTASTNPTNPSPAGVVDAKVIRTAEVLLNRAEAEYRSGAISAAAADLVLLRNNRYTGYAGSAAAVTDLALTGQPLLDAILLERRLELAFEGDRFFTLKRLALPVNRTNKGEKADGTGTLPIVLSLPAGDPKFQLPYPTNEILFNSGLKQNPGY
jgi:hypothetical protein